MYDGIVNVYKEQGFTSHDVVAKLRSVFGQKKIGHTGTLDPMAEGVLIIVLGSATKLADMILSKKKQYIATMKMGLTSETDDITGERLVPGDETKLSELFSDETELRKKISENLAIISESQEKNEKELKEDIKNFNFDEDNFLGNSQSSTLKKECEKEIKNFLNN